MIETTIKGILTLIILGSLIYLNILTARLTKKQKKIFLEMENKIKRLQEFNKRLDEKIKEKQKALYMLKKEK